MVRFASFLACIALAQTSAMAADGEPTGKVVRKTGGTATARLSHPINTQSDLRSFQDRSYIFRVAPKVDGADTSSVTFKTKASARLDTPEPGYHTTVKRFASAVQFDESVSGLPYNVVLTLRDADGAFMASTNMTVFGNDRDGEKEDPVESAALFEVVDLGDGLTLSAQLVLRDLGDGNARLIAFVADDGDGEVGSVEVQFEEPFEGPAPSDTVVDLSYRGGKMRVSAPTWAAEHLADTTSTLQGEVTFSASVESDGGEPMDEFSGQMSYNVRDLTLRKFDFGRTLGSWGDGFYMVVVGDPDAVAEEVKVTLTGEDGTITEFVETLERRRNTEMIAEMVGVDRLPFYTVNVESISNDGGTSTDACEITLEVGKTCTGEGGGTYKVRDIDGNIVRIGYTGPVGQADTVTGAWTLEPSKGAPKVVEIVGGRTTVRGRFRRGPVNDHIGAYNWRVEVNGLVATGEVDLDGTTAVAIRGEPFDLE